MSGIVLPSPEQQAEIDAHWANVRAGLHRSEPEPDWKQGDSVVAFHQYRAQQLIERAAWHARQAIDAGTKGDDMTSTFKPTDKSSPEWAEIEAARMVGFVEHRFQTQHGPEEAMVALLRLRTVIDMTITENPDLAAALARHRETLT
jgi:hypothetical protein